MYEGLHCMATRDFKKAAELFLESLSTFSTTELFSYNTFIFYTVLTAVIALDRVTLHQKVIHAPEILTVLAAISHLSPFLNGLYECKYKAQRPPRRALRALCARHPPRPHLNNALAMDQRLTPAPGRRTSWTPSSGSRRLSARTCS